MMTGRQYTDLLRLFELRGHPPAQQYLFLGNYTEGFAATRVKQGIEVLVLLLCYVVRYPRSVYLLRGIYEILQMNRRPLRFHYEVKQRYSVSRT